MPGALKDQLPNRALSGLELAAITKVELEDMLKKDLAFAPNIAYSAAAFSIELEYVLPSPHPKHVLHSKTREGEGDDLTGLLLRDLILVEFDQMVPRDYVFGLSAAYRHAGLTISLVVHVADPHEPKQGSRSKLTGQPPLMLDKLQVLRTSVVGLQRKVTLDNPNLDRIHHGLPIVVQRATPPVPPPASTLPGEPPTQVIGSPGVENKEFRYDATQFATTAQPVDTDISQSAAAKLGVPVQTGV